MEKDKWEKTETLFSWLVNGKGSARGDIFSVFTHGDLCVFYTDSDSATGEGAPVSGAGGCVPDASRAAGTAAAAALPGTKKQFQARINGVRYRRGEGAGGHAPDASWTAGT